MTDSSSAELLSELDSKRKRVRLGPLFVFTFGAAVFYLIAQPGAPSSAYALTAVLAIFVILAYWADKLRKTTQLWYDFEPEVGAAFDSLHKAASLIASCSKCWRIDSTAKVYDRKYHAGASNLVKRSDTKVRIASPEFLKTNVKTVAIKAGSQTLYFFPDRLLVFSEGKVGAVNYNDLNIAAISARFIEDGSQPRDAQVVDHTWRYVNKKGGPDLRFSSNNKLPICLYGEFHFSSPSGLNEIIQTSRADILTPLTTAIDSLAQLTSQSLDHEQPKPPPFSSSVSQGFHPVAAACLVILPILGIVTFAYMHSGVWPSQPSTPSASDTGAAPVSTIQSSDKTESAPKVPSVEKISRSNSESPNPSSQPIAVANAHPSTPPLPKFGSVADAQKEAVRRYPELAVRNSKLNAAFLARYKSYQMLNPDYFKDPSWPIRLVEEVSEPPLVTDRMKGN